MSKKSCEAAESIKDALLRMARVNCNFYLDLKGFLSMILFKKFFAPITLLLCFTLSLSLTGCSASSAQPFSKTGFYFDTVISLTCYGNDAEAVLNEAFELCEHYENLLSYTKEGSDIWNINHANGQPVTVDSETASLLQTALYWSEKTDGLIDPTITPISLELFRRPGRSCPKAVPDQCPAPSRRLPQYPDRRQYGYPRRPGCTA